MNKFLFVVSAILLAVDAASTENTPLVVKDSKMLSEAEVFRIIPLIPAAKSLFAQMFAPNPEHLKTLATDTLNHVTSKLDVIPVAGKDAVQQFEPFNSVNDVKLKKTFTTINSALSTYLAKLQAALAKIIPDANKAKDEAVAAILEAGKNSSSSIKEATLAGYIAPHWPKIMNSSGQKIFNCDVQLFKNQFEGIIKIEKTNLACAAVVTGKKSEMGVVVQKVVEIALVDLKLVTEAIPSCLKSVGVTNVAQTDALPADKVATLDTCLNSIETAKPLSVSVGSETLMKLFDSSISASKDCIIESINLLTPSLIPAIKDFVDCLAK